jgi:hypothetical protein
MLLILIRTIFAIVACYHVSIEAGNWTAVVCFFMFIHTEQAAYALNKYVKCLRMIQDIIRLKFPKG